MRLHALACVIMGAALMTVHLASGETRAASLKIYGPGGPYPAIRQCADLFAARHETAVDVVFGEPDAQAAQAAKDGDVYYTGAEYMMDGFIREHPGLIDETSVIYPAARRIGIIVRKGDPKGVKDLAGLAAPGLRILDVGLENMGGLRGAANANVALSVATGREGFAAWKADKDLDAWVTYRTWAEQMTPQEGEFIPIDGPQGLRRVPAAVMRNAPHPGPAKAFLEFLKTGEARAVFLRHGYEPY